MVTIFVLVLVMKIALVASLTRVSSAVTKCPHIHM